MNERLMDFLLKSEIARLPEEERKLYQFVTEAEDSLAEKAATVDEFYSLVLADSPVNAAMNYFQWPYDKVVAMLMDVEVELDWKIKQRNKRVKWIEFKTKRDAIAAENKKLFLFIN
ncbi:hypothetical protein DHX103_06890 [Planococcus sp. X10-3]|uniref:hypothetical protein n=1 Tax=Planococcus sp. X10-3 TaxID=3061240 RepID=UPI003BAF4DB0